MALIKEISLPNGVTAGYWKVIHVALNKQSMMANFDLGLFLNKTVADSGVSPFEIKQFSSLVTKDETTGNMIALGYSKIKIEITLPINIPGHSLDNPLKGAVDG